MWRDTSTDFIYIRECGSDQCRQGRGECRSKCGPTTWHRLAGTVALAWVAIAAIAAVLWP